MPIGTYDGEQDRPDDPRGAPVDGQVIELDELNSRDDIACRVALPRVSRPRNTGWGRMSLRGRTRRLGIGLSYRSCNRSEGFPPTRRCTCRTERPDHISEPGPVRLPKSSRLSKSPQPEYASEPPSGADGTASAQESRQPTLIQVNSRFARTPRAGGSVIDLASRQCGLAVDAEILPDSVLAEAQSTRRCCRASRPGDAVAPA